MSHCQGEIFKSTSVKQIGQRDISADGLAGGAYAMHMRAGPQRGMNSVDIGYEGNVIKESYLVERGNILA